MDRGDGEAGGQRRPGLELAEGSLPDAGFVCQEDVSLDAFLATKAGQMLAREPDSEMRDDIPFMPVA